MKLIRGWERRYAPDATGGLRLSKARLYRAIGEEEGLGDRREGEVRIGQQGDLTVSWERPQDFPTHLTMELDEISESQMATRILEKLAVELDDPEIALEKQDSDSWKIIQNTKVDDSELDSPFLFCLSREPATSSEWDQLRAALPERYDTWTITEDVASLFSEIEFGIKRWMGLNEITVHQLAKRRGWVAYTYDTAPPSGGIGDVMQLPRWFRKRRKYRHQEEYRLAWDLSSPQWEKLPETMEIELTRTGLGLFKPWKPPEH